MYHVSGAIETDTVPLMNLLKPFLLGSCALLYACHAERASGGGTPARLEQWSGPNSEVTTAATRVLETVAAWDHAWQQAQHEKPRGLDPARERAVAIFLGQRRSGGFGVEITSAATRDGKFVITYREVTPPPDAMVTMALTAPWTIAIVPRTNESVVFEKASAADRRHEK